MALDARLLKESLAHVEPHADRFMLDFYGRCFHHRPELRALFPAAMGAQRDRFLGALLRIAQRAEHAEFLRDYLAQLARDHRKYDVQPEHYVAVGKALIGALRRHVGHAWTPAMEQAWVQTYEFIAATMIEAAERDAADNPPWFSGEVLAHERRTHDIAVLTVRPHMALPYQAGQYVSVETQRWPRVWRPYSIANAPRSDGLLEFHVRTVGAGWVSSTLVHHTQVGDTLRLGAPRGSMLLDPSSARPILGVAGGTGLAPIKALVDQAGRDDPQRSMHVFFGTRHEHELYDMPGLAQLTGRYPHLVVICAAEHPSYLKEEGTVCDVALRYGSWEAHDIYVCGSPGMVEATITGLQDHEVPLARIRRDHVE